MDRIRAMADVTGLFVAPSFAIQGDVIMGLNSLPTLSTVWPYALAGLWVALGLVSFFPAAHGVMWKLRVGTTEYGHIFALLPLLTLIPVRHSMGAMVLCLMASLMLISSLPRAMSVGSDLPEQLSMAFPNAPPPRSAVGAPALSAPFTLGALFGLASPDVEIETLALAGGDGEMLPVDLYTRSETPSPRPLVVIVHGGSWNSGDRTQLPSLNRYLAARGYAVAAISYRFAPEHIYPAPLEDVLAQVEGLWARADALKIDPAQTVLIGRSSGAHLALLAGYRLGRDRVRGVVGYYPPTDLAWSWNNPSNPWVLDTPKVLTELIGGPLEGHEARYGEASPLQHVAANNPPTLVIHGLGDELVFPEQSRRLEAALRAVSVPSFALLLPWATHGCEANLAGPSGQLSTYAIERFLVYALSREGKRPRRGR
jgi:acetyl esterase/lipase